MLGKQRYGKFNVQSDHLLHEYMLPVFFAPDQLHRPPRSVEIQPMSQQHVLQLIPVTDWYSIRVKKLKT